MEDIDSYILGPALNPTGKINIESIAQNMQYTNENRKD